MTIVVTEPRRGNVQAFTSHHVPESHGLRTRQNGAVVDCASVDASIKASLAAAGVFISRYAKLD